MSDEATPTCAIHKGHALTLGWQGAECSLCERAVSEAMGCQCGGTLRCASCVKVRENTGDHNAKCSPNCDGLCAVCCPDS